MRTVRGAFPLSVFPQDKVPEVTLWCVVGGQDACSDWTKLGAGVMWRRNFDVYWDFTTLPCSDKHTSAGHDLTADQFVFYPMRQGDFTKTRHTCPMSSDGDYTDPVWEPSITSHQATW